MFQRRERDFIGYSHLELIFLCSRMERPHWLITFFTLLCLAAFLTLSYISVNKFMAGRKVSCLNVAQSKEKPLPAREHIQVVGNEKQWGSGRRKMIANGLGPSRFFFI
jgi:hypothetical protein